MSGKKQDNMSRRKFLRLAGLAGGTALLGACAPAPAAAPKAAPAAPAATAVPAAAAAKKYEGVTLRGLVQGGTAYEPFLKVVANEYGDKTGAKIEIDFQPWEQLEPKLLADLQSGQPKYDFFCSDIERQYNTYPDLLPLNDLIKKYNYNMEGFFQPVYKYGEGVAGGLAGVRFGLPIRVGASWVFYRTDLIPQFPTTWDEYHKVLKGLTKDGKYGLAFAGVSAQLFKEWIARYWSQGDPLLNAEWKPLINSAKGVKAASMMLEEIKTMCPPGMLGWDNPDASAAFLNGDVAVLEGWSDFVLADLENPQKSKVIGKWSVAKYPENGTGNFTQHNMIIIKKTKYPDATFEYIAAATGPENARRLMAEYREESPRKTVWSDPELLKAKPFLPGVAAAYDVGKPFLPGVAYGGEMFMSLVEQLSQIMAEKLDPQKGMDAAAKRWAELIAQSEPGFPYHE